MEEEWDDGPSTTTAAETQDSRNSSFKRRDDNGGGYRGGYNKRNNDENGDEGRGRRYNNDENGDGDRRRGRYNNDENGGGGRGRRYNNDENGEGGDRPRRDRPFNKEDENADGEQRSRRPKRQDDDNADGDGERNGEKDSEEKRVIYIPPEPTNDESEMFASGIKTGINFNKYDQIECKLSEKVAKPINSFKESGLRELLVTNIEKSGYTKPTPIQRYAIPTIMAGVDFMGCAQTGSGKTAAYILPILNKVMEDMACDHSRPKAIIVSPTRELAIQIFNEARKFALGSPIKIAIAYGGVQTRYQNEIIAKGCHILVATPGRLNDFISRGWISLEDVQFFVLDEADRMLDMGFKPEVEKIMKHESIPPVGTRRTLMFSATFPKDIQEMAGEFMSEYAFIAVGIVGGACADVKQTIVETETFKKRNILIEILKENDDPKGTIVFVETKKNADFLASFLSETFSLTTSIHGDRQQREREMALTDFRTGKMKILVATSVAARGLDIPGVQHVVNYDMPKSIDEYVHRIGRTGRVGNQGRATSFFDPKKDTDIAPSLVKILQQAGQEVPPCLESFSGGSYSTSAFGASDVRGGNDKKEAPKALEEEEEW